MKTYTFNEIVETLAPVIADKLNLRAVIDFTNGKTALLDFSSCGEPYTDGDIMVWSLQDDMEEEDWGTCRDYNEVFATVADLLAKYDVSKFYAETF